MYPNLRKTLAYLFIMQVLWIVFIVVTATGVWYGEATKIFIIFALVIFGTSLVSDTKLRCFKSTFICIGIYLGIVFLYKILDKENPEGGVLFGGIVFCFLMYIMLKRLWKFNQMLIRKYPWIYRHYNMYDIMKFREKEEYLNDSIREIMENTPPQNVREIIEDVQSTGAILFLCFETIEFGALFLVFL